MAKLSILTGTTSKTVKIFLQDTSKTSGAGLTGLTSATSGLTAYYIKEGQNSTTQISLSGGTLGTWSSGGFIVVDGTNTPGVYELGLPNLALSSAKSVVVYIQGAANLAPYILEIELTAVDNQSTTYGLAALPIDGTTSFTESYASLHSNPTFAQLLYEIRALLAEGNVASTTLTTKKIDGSTTAHTYTLNSSTAPTSITTAT